MRVAVTYENGLIFQHFGHTEQVKIYDVEDGSIVNSSVLSTDGFGHGALAGFLYNHHVDLLICGGIGGGAVNALTRGGIGLICGASGNCDEIVNMFLNNELPLNNTSNCNHHNHDHGDHECHCGSHGHHHDDHECHCH